MSSAKPTFHQLAVRQVKRETEDAVSVAFDVPAALAEAFAFTPGQYLTLRSRIDGHDVRRSYSICSGADDGELRIAVKRVDNGLFSSWMHGEVAAGDVLEVMTPTGRFGPRVTRDGRVHVALVAGSGITPVLSIVRSVLKREPASRFFLFYGNRSARDVLFREEIAELKDQFVERLSVLHILSREEQDLGILYGRLDGDKVRRLLTALVPAETIDEVYVCGPAGMITSVEPVLADLGIAEDRIHIERFVSANDGTPRRQPVPVPPDAPAKYVAALIVDGKRREVPVAEGESVLDAALRAGMDLPFACKGGMCATCRAKVLEGSAEMTVNYSLERWEKEAGFVLTCQAHPTSARIVVDYDHV